MAKNYQGTVHMSIAGLSIIKNWITDETRDILLKQLDQRLWSDTQGYPMQHYGWYFDPAIREMKGTDRIAALPPWIKGLADQIARQGIMACPPDMATVEMLLPGQGIPHRIEAETCFDNVIAILSLLSPIKVELRNRGDKAFPANRLFKLLLEPNSLAVLSGSARFYWELGITPAHEDTWQGQTLARGEYRRIVFRRVLDLFLQVNDPLLFHERAMGGVLSIDPSCLSAANLSNQS